MLARDRFQTETPNVIDPGEGQPPSRPRRPRRYSSNDEMGDTNTSTNTNNNTNKEVVVGESDESRDNRSRGLSSLSRYGNSDVIKHSLYTRNGNKGVLSKGIPIRLVLGLDDGDGSDDDDDDDNYDSIDNSDNSHGGTCNDDQDVIVFESNSTSTSTSSTMIRERETPFRDEDEHTSFRNKRDAKKTIRHRYFRRNVDADEENGIAQARLFAAAMLNESDKRHSKRDLVNSHRTLEPPPTTLPSTLRQAMNRASSFRNNITTCNTNTDENNRTSANLVMAMERASSFRNLNAKRHSSQLVMNRASSHRHISIDNNSIVNKTFDEKHLDNIWLVDDTNTTPDISKLGSSGSSKTNLLRQKLVRAGIFLVVGIIAIIIFALAAAESQSSFSATTSDDNTNLSAAVAISSDLRLGKIVGFLGDTTRISSVEDLYDVSSPQFRAARWLADEDSERLAVPTTSTIAGVESIEIGVAKANANANTNEVSPFDFVQRYVLLVLYFALGGDTSSTGSSSSSRSSWINGYNFASQDRHECSWYERVLQLDTSNMDDENDSAPTTIGGGESGDSNEESMDYTHYVAMGVACDRDLRVRSISLPANNLKGSIPSEIQYLSTLHSLNLRNNSIVGSIPENLQNLVHLTRLDLSSNRLTGPISPLHWIVGKQQRLTQLEILDLSNNRLVLGGGQSNTSNSHSHSNQRHSIGGETRLKTLALGGNNNYAHASDNAAAATDDDDDGDSGHYTISVVPDEIRYLTNLRELSLDGCNIGGRIPAWLFHELNKLQFLDASNNQLTGIISGVFPPYSGGSLSSMSPLRHLKSLLLHDNKLLTGTLPESIGLMPDLVTVTIHHTNMTVGTNAANLICWRGEEESSSSSAAAALESLTTDCGDATCPCCIENCCEEHEDCYPDVDWHTGQSSFSSADHHPSKDSDDEV